MRTIFRKCRSSDKSLTQIKNNNGHGIKPGNSWPYGVLSVWNNFLFSIFQKSVRTLIRLPDIVGNKAKGWISKVVFEENKARQIFWKKNFSYPLILTRTCAYQEVRDVLFSENLTCFVFLEDLLHESTVFLKIF